MGPGGWTGTQRASRPPSLIAKASNPHQPRLPVSLYSEAPLKYTRGNLKPCRVPYLRLSARKIAVRKPPTASAAIPEMIEPIAI